MNNLKRFKTWYCVTVQFESFMEYFEVCEVDVRAACKAVTKLIEESKDYSGGYYIEECTRIR